MCVDFMFLYVGPTVMYIFEYIIFKKVSITMPFMSVVINLIVFRVSHINP